MRVLVATNELQGTAPGDYSWTVEGELVVVDVTECSRPDTCGCGRGFPGIASCKATTTAMVVDLPHLTSADLVEVVADHVEVHWGGLVRFDGGTGEPEWTVEQQLADITAEYVEHIETVCRSFPIGTVIERSGQVVQARAVPHAA